MLTEMILIVSEQFCVHFPLVLAAYISIGLMRVPDLTIETAFVFGALCAAQCAYMVTALPFFAQIICVVSASLLGGALVGCISSTLTRVAHLPHLLSTILTFGIFHGLNQLISSSYVSLSGVPNYLATIALVPQHPEIIILCMSTVFLAVIGMLFCHTQVGYSCAVFGQNVRFFDHYGISATYIFFIGIVLSNALAGLSGYLFAQTSGVAEVNMGLGKALFCITCLILGKQLFGSRSVINCWIPIIGTLIYFAIQQLLLVIGFDSKYFTMIQSLIVLVLLVYGFYKQPNRAINHLGI